MQTNHEMTPELTDALVKQKQDKISLWQGNIELAIKQATDSVGQLSKLSSATAKPYQTNLSTYINNVKEINEKLNDALEKFGRRLGTNVFQRYGAIDAVEFIRQVDEVAFAMADLEGNLITLNKNLKKDIDSKNPGKKTEIEKLMESKSHERCETHLNDLTKLFAELKDLSVERFNREDITKQSSFLEQKKPTFERMNSEFKKLIDGKFEEVDDKIRGKELIQKFRTFSKALEKIQKIVQPIVEIARKDVQEVNELKKEIEEHRKSLAANYASMADLQAEVPPFDDSKMESLENDYQELLNPGVASTVQGLWNNAAEKPLAEKSLDEQIKALKGFLTSFSVKNHLVTGIVKQAKEKAIEAAKIAKAREEAQQAKTRIDTQKIQDLKDDIVTYQASLNASRASVASIDNIDELFGIMAKHDSTLEEEYEQFLKGPAWSIEGMFQERAEKSLDEQITALEGFVQRFKAKDSAVGLQVMQPLVAKAEENIQVVKGLKDRIDNYKKSLDVHYATGDRKMLIDLVDPDLEADYQTFLDAPKLPLEEQVRKLNAFVPRFGVKSEAIDKCIAAEAENARIAAEKAQALKIVEQDKQIEALELSIGTFIKQLNSYVDIDSKQDISDKVKNEMKEQYQKLNAKDPSLTGKYARFALQKADFDREQQIRKLEGFIRRFRSKVGLFDKALNNLVKAEKAQALKIVEQDNQIKALELSIGTYIEQLNSYADINKKQGISDNVKTGMKGQYQELNEKDPSLTEEHTRFLSQKADFDREAQIQQLTGFNTRFQSKVALFDQALNALVQSEAVDEQIKALEMRIKDARTALYIYAEIESHSTVKGVDVSDDVKTKMAEKYSALDRVDATLDWDYQNFSSEKTDITREQQIARLTKIAERFESKVESFDKALDAFKAADEINHLELLIAQTQKIIQEKFDEMNRQEDISENIKEIMTERYELLKEEYDAFHSQKQGMQCEKQVEEFQKFDTRFFNASINFSTNLDTLKKTEQARKEIAAAQPKSVVAMIRNKIKQITALKTRLERNVKGQEGAMKKDLAEQKERFVNNIKFLQDYLKKTMKNLNEARQELLALESGAGNPEKIYAKRVRLNESIESMENIIVQTMDDLEKAKAALKQHLVDAETTLQNWKSGSAGPIELKNRIKLMTQELADLRKAAKSAQKGRPQKNIGADPADRDVDMIADGFDTVFARSSGMALSAEEEAELTAIRTNRLASLTKMEQQHKERSEKTLQNILNEFRDPESRADKKVMLRRAKELGLEPTLLQELQEILRKEMINEFKTAKTVDHRRSIVEYAAQNNDTVLLDELVKIQREETVDKFKSANKALRQVIKQKNEADSVLTQEFGQIEIEEEARSSNVQKQEMHSIQPQISTPPQAYNKALKYSDPEIRLGLATVGLFFIFSELKMKIVESRTKDLTPVEEAAVGLFSAFSFVLTAGLAGVIAAVAVTAKTRMFGFWDGYKDKKADAKTSKAAPELNKAEDEDSTSESSKSESYDGPWADF